MAPSSDIVDAWGARRIVEWKEAGESIARICELASCSSSTVKRILKHHTKHGTERRPAPGTGQREGTTWHFAGSGRHVIKAVTAEYMAKADDDALLREVYQDLRVDYVHDELQFSNKVLDGRAMERDDAACAAWYAWFHAGYIHTCSRAQPHSGKHWSGSLRRGDGPALTFMFAGRRSTHGADTFNWLQLPYALPSRDVCCEA
jgi:hypothetical protein